MCITVNITEARARLSELVAAALRGEEVVICRAGKPPVRLEAVLPAGATSANTEDRQVPD